MPASRWTSTLALAVVLGLLGCNASNTEYKELSDVKELEGMKAEEHHHDEHGPHGGHILELGTYHGEIAMGENRQISVYILGGDAKTAAPVTGAQVALMLEGVAEPIALEASPLEGETGGAASRFVTAAGSVPEAVTDIEKVHGSVKLTLDGKETVAEVAHDHGHDHGDHGHAH